MPELEVQSRADEVAEKKDRLRRLLGDLDLDAVLLTTQPNVAWITGGLEDPVIRGDAPGLVWALVGRDFARLITQNVEGPRILAEEPVEELGFEVVQFQWYESSYEETVADRLRIGNDGNGPGREIAGELIRCRLPLTAGEQERMRELGADSCRALETACRRVAAGMTEHELASEIVKELELVRIFPSVLLVGADERRRQFRHPTVATAPINRDVLAVIVGVRGGLHLAASRTVAIGEPDPELAARHSVACEVEAAMIAATRPGAHYSAAFEANMQAYQRLGYEGEWRHHFQGGPMSYGPRDFNLTPPGTPTEFRDVVVQVGDSFAYNPTVQGAKSEDTFLVGENGPESLSNSSEWPASKYAVGGLSIPRPDILVVD